MATACIKHGLLVAWLSLLSVYAQAQFEAHATRALMGTRFEFTVVHQDSLHAQSAVQQAINKVQEIESWMSSWREDSETTRLNRSAGRDTLVVSQKLFDLCWRAQKISRLTQGAFDLSFAGLQTCWRFDGSLQQVPDSNTVAASIQYVDYRKIYLNPNTRQIYLPPKMQIGFGGIGKGYAADQIQQLWRSLGINNGLINAGGDILAWGFDAQQQPWKVAIRDPKHPNKHIAWLPIKNQAIVSSGDYERFITLNGKKYAHILDPRTGYPAQGLRSVTILCPQAEPADALATAVFVLGKTQGLALVNQLHHVECIIVDNEGNIHSSKGIDIKLF